LALLLVCATFDHGGAQLITDLRLESEEDVEDAYAEGRLDEQTRDELLELLRDPVDLNGDELSRLLAVPGVTPHDLRAIERRRDEVESFVSVADLVAVPGVDADQLRAFARVVDLAAREDGAPAPARGLPRLPGIELDGWLKMQSARDFHEGGDLRNDLSADLRMPAGAGAIRLRFRARSEEDERPGFEERSLSYDAGAGPVQRVIAGTIREQLGMGITLGRRVALTASLRTPGPGVGTLLVPRLGRYNGLYAALRAGALAPVVLISENRYALLRDRVLAASLERRWAEHSIGALGARQSLLGAASGDTFERDFLALFGASRIGLVEISGESSWSPGHGLGSELRVEARGAVFESGATVWHYGTDFVNVHGGGTADVDRVAFDALPEDEIEIRDRQAGERGALIETELDLAERWSVEGAFARWANALDGETDRKADLTLAWRASTRRRAVFSHLWDSDDTEGEARERRTLILDGRSDIGAHTDLRLRGVLRARSATGGDVHSGEIWLETSLRRLAPLSPWLRFRWVDRDFDSAGDAYAELQVEERMRFLDRYQFEARVRSRRYQDDEREVNPDTEARLGLRISL